MADDIIIFGISREEHDKSLNHCLKRLSDKGLTINASKCKLMSTSLSSFRQFFSTAGTCTGPKYVLDLLDAPVPAIVHEVRSFLGKANYNSKYIANYATVSAPLRDLTKINALVVNINIVVLRPFSNSIQPFVPLHSFINFTFMFRISGNHPFTPLVQHKHATTTSHHLAISFVSLFTLTQHLTCPSVPLICLRVFISM